MDNVTATETQDREGLQGDECRERFALCASAIESEEDASRKDAYDCAFDLHDQFTDDMLAISMDNVTATETQDREDCKVMNAVSGLHYVLLLLKVKRTPPARILSVHMMNVHLISHDQFTDDMLRYLWIMSPQLKHRTVRMQGDECRERLHYVLLLLKVKRTPPQGYCLCI
ncbi:hypothetical protein DPX39_070031700 [Trypanosoma brucei equiperdum]|uniref:Uncharacterized protein n=1 Tax=Trypanosoma brucei equiperdum TaxID=630700 RepID=A0A3L6L6D5_9TRYP|nr:hypothetical protein DPX39_070031700 [Trypanosoma brucei equiperdum]